MTTERKTLYANYRESLDEGAGFLESFLTQGWKPTGAPWVKIASDGESELWGRDMEREKPE